MFRFVRAKNVAHAMTQTDDADLHPILSASKIVQNSYVAEKLYEVKQLVSVTQDEWESYYLATIYRFAEYVQALPDRMFVEYSGHYGLLSHALDRAVAALKLRRGYMLPFGGDTETCYREQDIWTLAIFIASLFIGVWQVPARSEVTIYDKNSMEDSKWNALLGLSMSNESGAYYKAVVLNNSNECLSKLNHILVRALLPLQVLSLLSAHQNLFYQWLEYLFSKSNDKNALFVIINKADELLTGASNVLDEDVKSEQDMQLDDEDNDVQETVEHVNLADEFIRWIKQGVASNDIVVNAESSILHCVSDGTLIIFPDSFDRFKNDATAVVKKLLNDHVDDEQGCFIKEVIKASKDNCFTENKNSGGDEDNYVHEYYVGDWEDLNCISGLLVNTDKLFSEEELPEINHNLSRKPEL